MITNIVVQTGSILSNVYLSSNLHVGTRIIGRRGYLGGDLHLGIRREERNGPHHEYPMDGLYNLVEVENPGAKLA